VDIKVKENHPTNQIRNMEWNLVDITHLQQVNNKFTCVVYFWLDIIVAGFMIEFVVDTMKSYIAS
jgi:hypothetical protein